MQALRAGYARADAIGLPRVRPSPRWRHAGSQGLDPPVRLDPAANKEPYMRSIRFRSTSPLLFKAAAVAAMTMCASAAYAQSDAQVYESAIAEAARLCPGHSKERTTPGIRAVPVGALRVLAQHNYTMCPDRRLDAATPAVWYGAVGVFAWNPEIPGAVKLIAGKVDAMTRKEEFPAETLVWKTDGSAVTGVTVPMFEPRAKPVGAY
jgi:hypothetical protein